MKEKEKIEFSKLSRKERREQAREYLFGEYKPSEGGNIWGKKFTLFSLIGLLVVGFVAIMAVQNGKIDPQNLPPDEPFFYMQNAKKNGAVKDTLN